MPAEVERERDPREVALELLERAKSGGVRVLGDRLDEVPEELLARVGEFEVWRMSWDRFTLPANLSGFTYLGGIQRIYSDSLDTTRWVTVKVEERPAAVIDWSKRRIYVWP